MFHEKMILLNIEVLPCTNTGFKEISTINVKDIDLQVDQFGVIILLLKLCMVDSKESLIQNSLTKISNMDSRWSCGCTRAAHARDSMSYLLKRTKTL